MPTESKPVLVIPKLSEMRQDAYRPDLARKIDAQLPDAARQLATANFYLWPRRCMTLAIERWSVAESRFVGLDLTDFCRAIELEVGWGRVYVTRLATIRDTDGSARS